MKRLPFWISLLLLPLHGFSQIEDAWVHFTDKPNVSVALANPETILTLRAIQRKSQQGVPIDERDVPVNSLYVDQIEASSGITVLAQSKWFNNLHVRGTQSDITALLALSFVDEITFANKGLGTIRTPYQYQDKFEMEASSVIFDYGSATTQVEMINIHQVHQMDYTGDGVLVAVMDSGFPGVNIMAGFERLRDAGDLLGGYDFVDRTADIYAYTANSHGTWVLSTMGGYIENSYVGVAPDASYLLYRTEDAGSENPVEESYWVQAAERADSLGVDIVNTSLGYKSYDNSLYSHTSSDMDGTTTYITRGANIAVEKGMLLVNSAGNSGINGVNAPADSPSVVSVGAVQSNETYASFSSQGNGIQPSIKPDVAAMGVSTAVIDPSGSVVGLNGTSFSGPIIAGALACIKQASPSTSNTDLIQKMRESASQFGTPDYFLGYGIPDFLTVLNETLGQASVDAPSLRIYPNPFTDVVNIRGVSGYGEYVVFDLLGNSLHQGQISIADPQLRLGSVVPGVYMLRLKFGDQVQSFKLIKRP